MLVVPLRSLKRALEWSSSSSYPFVTVGLVSPALLHNVATLASGDESPMNFVPFRALFLANFRERLIGEVRRIPIPRTRVNKGLKKGQSLHGPWPRSRLLTTNRAALEPTGGAFPASSYSLLHPAFELVLSG